MDRVEEDERAQRRDLTRLEHDGVAGGECVTDLRGDLVQRVVPRRNAADDTERLHDDGGVADLALPLEARRELCGSGDVGDRQTRLDHLRHLDRRAHLLGDRLRDLAVARGHRLLQAGEELAALFR